MKVFKEEQRFTQIWLQILFFIEIGIVVYGIFTKWTDKHTNQYNLIFTLCLLFIIHLILYYTKLTTKINEHGISYRFFPFIKEKTLHWNEIDKVYTREYSPILEYGGWGIRYTFGKNGIALNIKGNKGIQLVLKNGKKILIGTQKPNEATKTIKNFIKND